MLAGATGLEPATSAVTGQRSNQLSYAPVKGGGNVENPPACVNSGFKKPGSPIASTSHHLQWLGMTEDYPATILEFEQRFATEAACRAYLIRVLGLGGYLTAWSWLHKLRRAMVGPGREQLGGEVEVDETYVGGLAEGPRDCCPEFIGWRLC